MVGTPEQVSQKLVTFQRGGVDAEAGRLLASGHAEQRLKPQAEV